MYVCVCLNDCECVCLSVYKSERSKLRVNSESQSKMLLHNIYWGYITRERKRERERKEEIKIEKMGNRKIEVWGEDWKDREKDKNQDSPNFYFKFQVYSLLFLMTLIELESRIKDKIAICLKNIELFPNFS